MKLQQIDINKQELSEIKEYLLVKGFDLSKEDLKELNETQKAACERFEVVETDDWKFLSIIKPFSASPYLHYFDYLEILKNSIFFYYGIRSKFDWHITDNELIDRLYKNYCESFGIIDKDTKRKLSEELIKEGYSNHDNKLD